jgi:tetratricopeptide (TPR) repeat protein
MSRVLSSVALTILLFTISLLGQVGKITIPAGSPEDKALQAITNEQDPQKKLSLYQDFVQSFSANPVAVVYGNWQLAQYYQTAGDPQKAIEYGDKALAGSPGDLDILVMQATLAQQLKSGGKVIDYAAQGGAAYHALDKQARPEGMSDADFAAHVQEDKDSEKPSYEFLEAAAFDSIANENSPKTRMSYIERFTPAFPDSRFADSVASYAMVALSQLNDMSRLVAYADKSLAANPNSLPTLLLLANAYADDPKPGSTAKAVTYAQKAIAVAKADAPDADRSRKLSAGVAHSTLGFAYMKQEKTQAAIPELKTAAAQLKGGDDQSYAVALYRLGFAYAKLNHISEAREVLTEAVKIPGPVQQPAQDLLLKVNAARAKGQ